MLLFILIKGGTYLTLAQAECPRTGTCAWLPHRCFLPDPGRRAVPWLFGCPAASEWAGRGSTYTKTCTINNKVSEPCYKSQLFLSIVHHGLKRIC